MKEYNFELFLIGITNQIEYVSNSLIDTLNYSYEFAKYLKKTDIVVLNGELGSGKTIFVKGIAKYFGVEDEVSSPTFTIVNEYITNNINIYHFDVYRLDNEKQFMNTIGTEYFENGISIIEWGNIIKNILPKDTIYIDISKIDDNTRNILIRRNV
ncbi:MAG: tRNA (adenosine(37)-N6)-threonylcarbamoyltransferase complex ATPase subunit type 1 TsaE [Clostridia bacterium]|nr:tRNA (adenosine(37)-N6)-threonylcarbamoyltransferase complex ATPase subunit type 1 TsaE [Clostridia bacterium]MDD4386893.1 tRNA (adenosine(37)-N6)-threonylcarbamoyltransferase complex ATPase subunit type 1 TsaE [Clostridia bacterium]